MTEPRTEAGRRLLLQLSEVTIPTKEGSWPLGAVLAIEAEAASWAPANIARTDAATGGYVLMESRQGVDAAFTERWSQLAKAIGVEFDLLAKAIEGAGDPDGYAFNSAGAHEYADRVMDEYARMVAERASREPAE